MPNAYVHHKFAPSNIRNEHKIRRYRYPVIKNKLYFALKHARDYVPLADILLDNWRFAAEQAKEGELHAAAGACRQVNAPRSLVVVARRVRSAEETLARALATQGHIVCVIAESPDFNRVDLDDGVCMHHSAAQDAPNWSANVQAELQRTAAYRSIDAIQAVPGAANALALTDGAWPLVSSFDAALHRVHRE